MFAKQKQVLDSFVRVREFVDAHPVVGGRLRADPAREMFDDALRRARAHAGTQEGAPGLGRAELLRQQWLVRCLKDDYMRPIVTIARAQIDPGSNVGLRAALRMPASRLSVQHMLQACDAMIETARPFEALLIAHGMPVDFLARFKSACDELAQGMGTRAGLTTAHVMARKGLQVELSRARLAVDRLDAVVRAAFRGEEALLKAWRAAKRVHRLTGGAATPAQRHDSPDASGAESVNGVELPVGSIDDTSLRIDDRWSRERLHAA